MISGSNDIATARFQTAFDERLAAGAAELVELAASRKRLQDESDKLLTAHFVDAIDLETLKRYQDRLRIGLADIDRRINDEHDHIEGPRKQIPAALWLLVNSAHLYARSDEQGKRPANQTFTDGIDISEDEEASILLAEPFTTAELEPTHVGSSSASSMVNAVDSSRTPG